MKQVSNWRAFKGGGNRLTNVVLSWFRMFGDEEQVADGFKEAADLIVDGLSEGKRLEHPDKFFWPVSYLYRHALELKLKEILRTAHQLSLTSLEPTKLGSHDLMFLWKRAREALKAWCPHGDERELVVAARYREP
jgi:hypothetical protein